MLKELKELEKATEKEMFSVGLEDFFKTYIAPPFGCEIFTLCIMADRGARFDYKKVDRNKLHELLRDLKVKTMGMAKLVFHGDALVHNFVYNESSDSLHLIDFDEGTLETNKVPRRSLNFTSDYPWYEALLYPNALRRVGESYTRVQFAASVLLFVMGHQGDQGDGDQKLEKLQEKAEELGEILRDSDLSNMCWKDETAVPDHVKKLVQELDELVDGLLQTEYGNI